MDFNEHFYSVLLVSSSDKLNKLFYSILNDQSHFNPVTCVPDCASASRCLLEKTYDLVVINTPLPDCFGTKLAIDIVAGSSTGVLLLVKAEHYPEVYAVTSPHGVLTLSKPTTAQSIVQSLQLLCGTRERLRRMEQKAATLEEKMQEIRIVNRAKLILIEQLKMTEAEAHRFIEKQAMDRCVTRIVIAESIITTYK